MNQDISNINSVAEFLKMHPFFAFILSILAATSNLFNDVYTMQLPPIAMQIGQWIAWLFIYATGAISVVGFLEKRVGFKVNLKFLKRKR